MNNLENIQESIEELKKSISYLTKVLFPELEKRIKNLEDNM